MSTAPRPDQPTDDAIGRQLASLLRSRADAVDVHPDLDAVVAAAGGAQPDPAPTNAGWWLAVAALLAVVGSLGILRSNGPDGATATGEPPAPESTAPDDGDRPGADPAAVGDPLLVWLDPGVDPRHVWAIADTLRSRPEVTSLRYIGPEETWEEFADYFADQPEILEVVEQDRLPTSFEVGTTDPFAVASAVEDLPGVDAIEFDGRVVEPDDSDPPQAATPTDRIDSDPDGAAPPSVDPLQVALATGATTIVYGGPDESPAGLDDWDGHLIVWHTGSSQRLGPFSWPRVSRGVILDRVSDSGPDRAYDLEGTLVCEARLPDESLVHHATTRVDGTVVLGVDHPVDDPEGLRYEAFAHDCETGRRTPIEPFRRPGTESELTTIERIAGRTFEIHSDAEGNARRILDEDGTNLIGDGYAGLLAWSDDGSILVFSDHAGSASPHLTRRFQVRDTGSGDLLWEAELPQVVARLDIVDDRLVVGVGVDEGGWVATESLVVFELTSGRELGRVAAPPGLVHLD